LRCAAASRQKECAFFLSPPPLSSSRLAVAYSSGSSFRTCLPSLKDGGYLSHMSVLPLRRVHLYLVFLLIFSAVERTSSATAFIRSALPLQTHMPLFMYASSRHSLMRELTYFARPSAFFLSPSKRNPLTISLGNDYSCTAFLRPPKANNPPVP